MKRESLPRSPLKRRATEVHKDSRTQRERTRGDADKAALAEALDDLLEEVDEIIEQNEQVLTYFRQQGGQ